MSENMHRKLGVFLKRTRTTEGKITIFTSIVACLVFVCLLTVFSVNVPQATASNVTTSVTVLNTPPSWTVDAQESTESSTSTPTNAGSVISWNATGTDSSFDSYYLLICKLSASSTPTAHNGAAPTCDPSGTNDQWAVSASSTSGLQATASTSTINDYPFNNEKNDWIAWICDNNATLAKCNVLPKTGSGLTASPFVINHIPVFYSISNNSPQNPGGTVTWTSGSYDNDVLGGAQQVRLVVCRTPGFANGSCTGGNGYATSTLAASNAATSTPFAIPTQDRLYNAYVYLVDTYNLAATSTFEGTNSFFAISNVAPTVTASTISLVDYNNATTSTGTLTLTVPSATSGPFKVTFTVVDNNGCQNASSTNEIASNIINLRRSGIASTSCLIATDYNSNSCYSAASGNFAPFYNCTQDAASCSGPTDSDATFTCTFSLWFNADPTDASTQFTAQNWLASVRATDDNAATSSLSDTTAGHEAEVISFLAFNVSTTSIAYGSLQPGDTTTPLVANTDLQAIGNIGLDEDLYGSTMCTTWVSGGGSGAPDNCDTGGANAATKIPVTQQVVATGTVAYTTAVASSTLTGALPASTTPRSILINVPKTIGTTSAQIATRNTFWGIAIPFTITQAGNYSGQNTITAKKSAFANW